MFIGNEETSRQNVTSYILLVSAGLILAGGLVLPWYSIERGVFEQMTGSVGAVYRVPTIVLGALTFTLGLLMRTELGPRLWRLPMALTVAAAALAVAISDVSIVMANFEANLTFPVDDPVVTQRIGEGVWVVVIGTAMQVGLGLLSWGLERTPRAERTVRA